MTMHHAWAIASFQQEKHQRIRIIILKKLRATTIEKRRVCGFKKINKLNFYNRGCPGLAWASVPLCTKRHPCASVFKVETKLCLVAKSPIRLNFAIARQVKYCKINLPLQFGVLGLRIAGLKSRKAGRQAPTTPGPSGIIRGKQRESST
jgi:hypothetical protein